MSITRTPMKSLTCAALLASATAMTASTAQAGIIALPTFGTAASATTWDTLSNSSGVFTNPVGEFNENPGVATTSASASDARGNGQGLAQLTGLAPVLKAESFPSTTQTAVSAFAMGITPVQYSGPDGATLTLNLSLTGDLNRPGETWAQISGSAMLLEEDIFFDSFLPNYFEFGGILDNTDLSSNVTNATLNLTDSLSTIVNNGDIVHIAMSLSTSAGWSPAYADAFSTFTGSVTTTAGSLTSLVPEPASITFAGLACVAMVTRRR